MKIDLGGGFLTLLTVVFIALKLGEVGTVATWSWWLVLSPMWVPFAIIFLIWFLAVTVIVLFNK